LPAQSKIVLSASVNLRLNWTVVVVGGLATIQRLVLGFIRLTREDRI